jgi:hypothetical protein
MMRNEVEKASTNGAAASWACRSQFVWGGRGMSFLPHLKVDQYEWTQHDRFWREDLKRAREELGITYLRYALPAQARIRARKFDWSMADERIARCRSSASSRSWM